MRKILLASLLTTLAVTVQAGANDDPLVTLFEIDQLEIGEGKDNPLTFEGQFWAGYDLNKLWIKAEAERTDGHTEELELQLLYSRALSPFWNLQVGGRRELKPEPDRDWGVIALQGLAPYFLEVDASLFVGGAGCTALRLEAEYELLLSQRLILSPDVEINVNGYNDPLRGTGSGLADAEFGMRLRYEIRREFAPYIGVIWIRKYGNTADFATAGGEDIEDTQFAVGIRAWY